LTKLIINLNCIKLCLLILVLAPNFTYSEALNLEFERVSIEQGLSDPHVFSIYQDSYGFMWFGTGAGLNKYDGSRFTYYLRESDNPMLVGETVWSLFADRSGVLWAGTLGGGLYRYSRDEDSFSRITHDPNDKNSISSNTVRSIYEDRDGILWIGCSEGILNRYDRKTKTFRHYKFKQVRPDLEWHNFVNAMCEDSSGNLWVGTNHGGLVKFNKETETALYYTHDPLYENTISDNSVWSLLIDRNNNLWVGTRAGGLDRFDLKTEYFIHHKHDIGDETSIGDNEVLSSVEDDQGVLWFGTNYGGLNRYDPDTRGFIRYTSDINQPGGISDNTIWAMFVDKSGVLWIGTENDGLVKADCYKKKLKHYKPEPGFTGALSHKAVWSIFEDHIGDAWIGTFNGLNRFDRQSGKYTSYYHDSDDPSSLSMNQILSIFEDHSNFLWIGTAFGGLNRYNRDADTFTRYDYDIAKAGSIGDSRVRAIFEDSRGRFYLGTGSGLSLFNRKNGWATNCLQGISVLTIFEDSDQDLWVTTEKNGFFLLELNEDGCPIIAADTMDNSLSTDHVVFCIYESANKKGLIWFGTAKGLLRYNKKNRQDRFYSKENSKLNCNYVAGIYGDKDGTLWLSTDNGMWAFDEQTGEARKYDVDDGIQSRLYNPGAHFRNKEGYIYFGGVNGYNRFHPDSLADNPISPPIVITDFRIDRQSIHAGPDSPLAKHISVAKEAILTHEQTNIEIEYAALHYSQPLMNQYAYKLEPYETEWKYVGNEKKATYTYLPPGEYDFFVKGANNDGVWNEEGTSLHILVHPPWWKTNWAYFGYLISLVAIITILYRFRMAQIHLQHQIELEHLEAERYHELDELKSRFFANISHEFRTPLTLILGPVGKMLGKLRGSDWDQDLNLIQRQAKRLLELVTQLLDLSKLEAGKMKIQVSQCNIIPLLKGLTLSFASLAERNNISLGFNPLVENIQVFVEKEAITKIMNNLLSNAFKFVDPGGSILVNIGIRQESAISSDGELHIAISDSGIGIPEERREKIFQRFYQANGETRKREGAGIGLALTKELVELHKGTIEVRANENEGSTFIVRIPLGNKHLSPDEIGAQSDDDDTLVIESASFDTALESDDVKKHRIGTGLSRLLIVEDNPDVRSFIRSHLDRDYVCYEAENGKDGVQQTLKLNPDLIISDVMMPEMNGIDFCNRLKSDERTSHIPIVLLTAKADMGSKLEGLETGADDYLTKPFEANELKLRIRNLIKQRQLLREQIQKEIALVPDNLNLASIDKKFLEETIKIISQHLDDQDFSVGKLSKKILMSRQHLNRKLKSITGQTPLEFIRSLRLKRAALLLRNQQSTVTEVVYKVGFSSPSHFTKCFQREFGKTPSAYLREQDSWN